MTAPIEPVELAGNVWTIVQPYLEKAVAKGSEAVGAAAAVEGGKRLWGWLAGKLTRPSAKEAATDLEKAPTDTDLQAAFRVQLAKALMGDPTLRQELAELVKEIGATVDQSNSVTQRADVSGGNNVVVQVGRDFGRR